MTCCAHIFRLIRSNVLNASRIFLAGQSAGAHLAACSLIMQAKKEYFDDPTNIVWRSSQLRGYLAISGG
jgi:prenylcysteine alpha-carboxyl methylesterase